MNAELQYSTVEPSITILTNLYALNPDTVHFACKINVPYVRQDDVIEIELCLYVRRITTQKADRIMANGDLIYATSAKLDPHGEEFPVDVVIRNRGNEIYPATISISEQGNDEAIKLIMSRK